MNKSQYQHLWYGIFGLLMGLILSFSGFSDFQVIHNMFVFKDFRLLLLFIGTLIVAGIGFAILSRTMTIARKSFNRGTIPGSILFGIGWAITGACPSIALVQFGEGKLLALITLFGIFFGVWVYRNLASSGLKFDNGVCGEE